MYRVFKNSLPPFRAQISEPWVQSMIVQLSLIGIIIGYHFMAQNVKKGSQK